MYLLASSYRWAQTRIIPPPLLLERIGEQFEHELRCAVERGEGEQHAAPSSAICREIVSLGGSYLHLAVVPDSLLDALEDWLHR